MQQVVCFSPDRKIELSESSTCLLIRKDYFKKFLKESGFRLVWICQGEKQILGRNHEEQPRFDHAIGGIYHMNASGTIVGNMHSNVRNYK